MEQQQQRQQQPSTRHIQFCAKIAKSNRTIYSTLPNYRKAICNKPTSIDLLLLSLFVHLIIKQTEKSNRRILFPKTKSTQRTRMNSVGGKLIESIVQEPKQTNQRTCTHTIKVMWSNEVLAHQWECLQLVFSKMLCRLIASNGMAFAKKFYLIFVVCHRCTVVIANKDFLHNNREENLPDPIKQCFHQHPTFTCTSKRLMCCRSAFHSLACERRYE